jgi:hypothetical protein
MKRITLAVGMVILVFAVSIWAQTQAPQPDPELKKLGAMMGHWTYEGEYKASPLGPAGKAKGEEFIQWILGGFFLQDLEIEKGALGETRMALLYAYDPASKNIVGNGLGSDGGPVSGIAKVSGNTITFEGKFVFGGKENLIRTAFIVATNLMNMTQKVEISVDGKTWAPVFDAIYTKVLKPAPKK